MRYQTEQHRRQGQADSATDTLARGLGIFSIALGVMEVVAGGALARALGMRRYEGLIRLYGIREIATGIGILSSKDPTPWIWGRVLGDGLDLGTLAPGLSDSNPKRENVGMAWGAVAGVTALDLYCAKTLSSETREPLPPLYDYSDRRGMPRSPEQMRGAARDFQVPRDMRPPRELRPFGQE
jgi:hypothetical protein